MKELLRVEKPGLLTTVQDLGRPGAAASGVTPGGAMDRFALRVANLLAGDEAGAPALECTLVGPRLVALAACTLAIAGADLGPVLNGAEIETWSSFHVKEGDVVEFAGRRDGARAYVAVAGGVRADRWLGSCSTNLGAARGGFHGRPLKAGDLIESEPPEENPAPRRLDPSLLPRYTSHELAAVVGPHFEELDQASQAALFESEFVVSHRADRMGYRLDGPRLGIAIPELLSFGLVAGALQVPPGGEPILLMADHQTAGGYPVVATVVSASMPVAAQLAPGDRLTFRRVTFEEARAMRRAQESALATLRTA